MCDSVLLLQCALIASKYIPYLTDFWLCLQHNPGLTVDYQHQLWLLFTSLGLCEEMTAKSEVGSPRRSPKASPLIEPEPFTRSPQIHTLVHNPGSPEPVQLPEPVLRPPAAKVAAKVEVEYSPVSVHVCLCISLYICSFACQCICLCISQKSMRS